MTIDVQISTKVSDSDFKYLQSLFGADVRDKDGMSLIMFQQEVIGFYQMSNLNLEAFIIDYDLGDYDMSSINEQDYTLLENLFIKNSFRGLKIGSTIVQKIKNDYSNNRLILYSDICAELFWVKQGFQEFDKDVPYVYADNV